MRFISLASGSRGNAYVLDAPQGALLIDCGLSGRTFLSRCRAASFDPERLCGVLFTHNHTDHVKGLAALHKKFPQLPLFANSLTAEAICLQEGLDSPELFCLFENGQSFEAGPFVVQAFSVPHDVPDPVGFSVRCGELTYFHATDAGAPLDSIGAYLAEADMATLEANHDPQLLAKSARPPCLKNRIRGPRGHLSNEEAAELVAHFATPRLKYLHLAHLSQECNAAHLAYAAISQALTARNLLSVKLAVLEQDQVFSPLP
ncbi:MAG TPA: hypothetical protein DDY72_04485 [Verrucomicrobia bacterium]|nr:hypothetical protein [Verrucomicrobiota bacterium]